MAHSNEFSPASQPASAVAPSTPGLIGSGWDAGPLGPDAPLPQHLRQWTEGSAVAPELAAANVLSLVGQEVIEALVGDRLARLGGHADQYATAQVQSLIAYAEPVAEAGGWWCSGLDPQRDWAPMGWGCFKPDRPRWDGSKRRHRKYEHPLGAPARVFWLRVPAGVAEGIARRFELDLPPAVRADQHGDAGAFWRWWVSTPALPLVITEGAKKAGALLSAGVPAVALSGISMGCPKGDNGRRRLHPDLAAVRLKGRSCSILFDHSESEAGQRDLRRELLRLGRLLDRAGAAEVLIGTCPGPAKGADDHLVAGGSWEQLAEGLEPITAAPALHRLRPADRVAPAGQWLSDACPLPSPEAARLVALSAPMGAGKTEAIAAALAPHLAAGTPVVLLTHRRSLGAALAERLGLPWGEAAAPGSDLRRQGIALCVDSLSPRSGMRFEARAWAGAVVLIDEADQVLRHALQCRATAVAGRRLVVLQQLQQLLSGSLQVICASAQLDQPSLDLLEQVCGSRALLISSEHQPAAGRELVAFESIEGLRLELVRHLRRRRRLWISTTAQKASAPNSAQNLAALAAEHWPGVRALVVDSSTVSDPEHPASQLAIDPNGIAAEFDLVICTPALASGVSVTLQRHFDAVFAMGGGTTDPGVLVQSVARVRADCPRFLYAPERSPGSALLVGCGSTDPATLVAQLRQHEAAGLMDLIRTGWELESNSAGPWLPLWAQQAAHQNRQRLAYRATVLALLEAEGYRVRRAEALGDADAEAAESIGADLRALADAAQAAEDQQLIATDLITDSEAAELGQRDRLSPADRAKLQRWRIGTSWALGEDAPTPELLAAHREGLHRKLRLGWLLRREGALDLVREGDGKVIGTLLAGAPKAGHWAPDLVADLEAPRLRTLQALGVDRWLHREGLAGVGLEWFGADDPQLLRLHESVQCHALNLQQVLGVGAGKRAIGTLRRLLALVGFRLESRRRRSGQGRRAAAGYEYRVIPAELPAGASREAMEAAWEAQLQRDAGRSSAPWEPIGDRPSWMRRGSIRPPGVCTKNPPVMGGEREHTRPGRRWAAGPGLG